MPTADPPDADPPTADPPDADPPTADPPDADPPTADPPGGDPPDGGGSGPGGTGPGGPGPGCAVVLAGGTGRRLGGADKPGLLVAGVSLLDRVLAALPDVPVVVVGGRRTTCRPVRWAREQPPGGGPLAALAAGLPVVDVGQATGGPVAVLAADLPFLDAVTLRRLTAAARGHDGALLVDPDGREQWLCGVWDTGALRGALAGVQPHGGRLRAVLAGLDAVRLPATGPQWLDCDTPGQLAAARARLSPPGSG